MHLVEVILICGSISGKNQNHGIVMESLEPLWESSFRGKSKQKESFMKRMLVVLLAAAMSWGVVSVVTAQADEQAGKAQEVARMVESSIGDAKMMPAPEVQLSRLTKGLQLSNEQQKQIRQKIRWILLSGSRDF